MSNMMIQKKHFLLLEAFLFLIFLVGCTTRKNISGEEHKYEQLSELPGTDAYQAIETICSPEDAALMEEDFYDEAKLWRYCLLYTSRISQPNCETDGSSSNESWS